MAQSNGQAKFDDDDRCAPMHPRKSDPEQPKEPESEESNLEQSSKLNRKNLAILATTVVVIVLIIVFAVLLLTTKTPRFRMSSIVVENLNYSTSSNPSFSMRLSAAMTLKNPNYGYFSYGITNVSLAYRGEQIGQVLVPGARMRGLRTRNIKATFDLNSDNVRKDPNLGSDIRSGFLTFTSQSRMSGRIYVMFSGNRRKLNGGRRSAAMNCTLTVNLVEKLAQDIKCS